MTDYPLVAGNWKMNCNLSEAMILASQISMGVESVKHIDVVLCPPVPFVYPLFEYIKTKPKNLFLGIQNSMWEKEGRFTGEVSADMFRGVCRYVIIGHSERRSFFGETNDVVARKTAFVLKENFIPIVCVGEKERFHLEDRFNLEVSKMSREGGILFQIDKALSQVPKDMLKRVVLAYEPVWAIGTGNAAEGAYAAAICYIVRDHLSKKFSSDIAQDIKILYGGSVSSKNVREYMLQPSVDGLLVGTASIKASEFIRICQITSEVKSGRTI